MIDIHPKPQAQEASKPHEGEANSLSARDLADLARAGVPIPGLPPTSPLAPEAPRSDAIPLGIVEPSHEIKPLPEEPGVYFGLDQAEGEPFDLGAAR